MSEWREVKLKDLVNYVVDNRGKNPPYVSSGHEVIETGCISGKSKFPDYGLVKKYVGKDTYNNWFRKGHPQKDDLLVITVGNGIGSVSIMQENRGVITQNLIALRFDTTKADANFYFYFLNQKAIQEFLRSLNIGSAQPSLKVPHLLNLDVPLPPINFQTTIASILSSLDDKIDLLHRQNQILEKMAETLFRQWFVEEAKEDWEEGTISDLVEFNPRRTLIKNTIAPFLEMSNLSTTTYSPSFWYDRAFTSGTKFQNGDTLLARITPCLENGKTAYVDFLEGSQVAWGSTEYIVMRTKGDIHPFFAYVLARFQDFRDFAEGCMSGSSGRQRVDVQNLKGYVIKMPDKLTINKWNDFAQSTVLKSKNNNEQIRTLTSMRDNLLPKLMSGEVRVDFQEA